MNFSTKFSENQYYAYILIENTIFLSSENVIYFFISFLKRIKKVIELIEINNYEKKHSHDNDKVNTYFMAIYSFDIPMEQ